MSLKFISTPRWFSHFIGQAGHAPSSSFVRKNATFSQTLFTPNVVASFPSCRAFASSPTWKSNPQYRIFFPRRSGSTTTFTYSPPGTLQRSIFRRFNSSRANQSARPAESGSLSQRLKKLSREYGWAALGVYLLLSAMDFPFCFIAVRHLGAERIGHYEHVVVETVKGLFGAKSAPEEQSQEVSATQPDQQTTEAQKKNNGDGPSLWTQLALAYAVHKSLIFIRVPLTAAITPKVVKVLRVWGWDLAKRRPRGM